MAMRPWRADLGGANWQCRASAVAWARHQHQCQNSGQQGEEHRSRRESRVAALPYSDHGGFHGASLTPVQSCCPTFAAPDSGHRIEKMAVTLGGTRPALCGSSWRAAAISNVCETPPVPEAPLRMSKNGLVVDGEGWFVVNARESRWRDEGPLGSYCTFEGKRRFPHFGINITVLEPGERMAMYHRENAQEAFLVLAGECTLIVEGKKRTLTEWDLFYCAPGTDHVILAASGQSAIVLAVGARGRGVGGGILYKISKAAARYGASVLCETPDPRVAYAGVRAKLPRSTFVKYRQGWLRD